MAKGPWNTGTWDDAQWDSLPVTGVSATGGVGSLGTQQSLALAGNSASGEAGSLGASTTAGLTGVSAVGVVGDETDSVEVALSGVGATGETGSVEHQKFAALSGVEAAGGTGTLTATVEPVILAELSHDGDKHRQKKWDEEKAQREKRKEELIRVYEQLHETRPEVAERIVEPHLTVNIATPTVNWDAMLRDLDRVERLMREYQEMDDEEVLLLL